MTVGTYNPHKLTRTEKSTDDLRGQARPAHSWCMEEQGQRGAARKKPIWTRAAESEPELTAPLGPHSPVQQGQDADAGGEAGPSRGTGC